MNQHAVFTADVVLELTNGFKKWLAFNIADGTADFNNSDFGRFVLVIMVKTALDGVGNMRDNLNGIAPEIASAFCR